jgi:hypothetical protein
MLQKCILRHRVPTFVDGMRPFVAGRIPPESAIALSETGALESSHWHSQPQIDTQRYTNRYALLQTPPWWIEIFRLWGVFGVNRLKKIFLPIHLFAMDVAARCILPSIHGTHVLPCNKGIDE